MTFTQAWKKRVGRNNTDFSLHQGNHRRYLVTLDLQDTEILYEKPRIEFKYFKNHTQLLAI